MLPNTATLAPIQPSQECVELIEKSRDFVRRKVDGKFLADYSRLGQSAEYIATRRAIIAAMAESDLEGCKVALRKWCQLVVAFTHDNGEKHA